MTDPYSLGDPAAFDGAIAASSESAAPGTQANQLLFPDFKQLFVQTGGEVINTLVGGSGPPLLLLHGHPETHVAWHKVAPALTDRFTVVVTDLRGYGDSGKPDGGPGHVRYSKREMAQDQIDVMRILGFIRFSAAGHDCGGHVLFQMMLDHPDAVERALVLDTAPPALLYSRTNRGFAQNCFWWFFHIQPAPLPEMMIGASPKEYLTALLSVQNSTPGAIVPEAFAEYLRCFQNPACIRAMCEDFRASVTIDTEIEKRLKYQKITAPLLALWGEKGTVGRLFDIPGLWRAWAPDVTGFSLPCGHLIPEEDPKGLLGALNGFLPEG